MKSIFVTLFLLTYLSIAFAQSPLAGAIEKGDILEIRLLLDEGARANDADAVVKIVESKMRTRFIMLDILLQHGLDLNRRFVTAKGAVTPLILAVLEQNNSMAKFMVNRGANFKSKDGYGRAPVCLADQLNNFELILFFEDIGASRTDCN